MANRSRCLYTGVTSNLVGRVYQHRNRRVPGFTARYKLTRLVYFESTTDVRAALARERQIKGWSRSKKIRLVESLNPAWEDLSTAWFDPV